jgi:hypothetical protein
MQKMQKTEKIQKMPDLRDGSCFCGHGLPLPTHPPGGGRKIYTKTKKLKKCKKTQKMPERRIHSRAENNIRARARKLIVAVF